MQTFQLTVDQVSSLAQGDVGDVVLRHGPWQNREGCVAGPAPMVEDTVARLLAARAPEDVLAIPELRSLSMKPRLAVRDVMTPEAKTILPDASARDALDLLIQRRFHAVPVVGETGEVLGVVTDRDLLRALLREPRDRPAGRFSGSPRQIKIRDIMSRTVLCVGVDMDVDEVANMMINKDIDLLPVVSEGTLAGVLTRGDIIRKLYGR